MLFQLSKLTTIETDIGHECVHLISSSDSEIVAILRKDCIVDDLVLFKTEILIKQYNILSSFNWQTIRGEWRATDPIFYKQNRYQIVPSINFRSELENIEFSLEGPRFQMNETNNFQKRLIYTGYWLSDQNISSLVQNWKSSNITHVLLTFILCNETTGLYADTSMIPAFNDLTETNKKLLTDNFIIGISAGGAAEWPVPLSNVYTQGKYKNNPQLFASDLIALLPKAQNGDYWFTYIDFDLENLEPTIDVDAFSTFFGTVAQILKQTLPNALISHAPQTPYFTSSWNNIYTTFYLQYSDVIDFLNIQFYNNGPSNTFEEIFINSDQTSFPGVAVSQLIQKGIQPSAIVVGKPVNATEGSEGYVVLNPITTDGTLANIVQQAFQDSSLTAWASKGGVFIWYYNTQTSLSTGPYLSQYVQTVYHPPFQVFADSDNEELLTFFTSISSL